MGLTAPLQPLTPLLHPTNVTAPEHPDPHTAHADGSVTDGGLTLVHGGRWAAAAAETLAAAGVAARVEPEWLEFQRAVAVKLLWASIFWLMSDALGGATVSACGRVQPVFKRTNCCLRAMAGAFGRVRAGRQLPAARCQLPVCRQPFAATLSFS